MIVKFRKLLAYFDRVFSLDHLDDYQKHFTVMNYRSDAPLKQVNTNFFRFYFHVFGL